MSSVFVTGFPGFIGSRLIERLVERYPTDVTINCLVQPAYRDLAETRVIRIEDRQPLARGRIRLHEGDITDARLGLLPSEWATIAQDTIEIFHLAAIYDLSLERELGMAVNVRGTQHMLDFAERARENLRRFHYMSTCYVSGRYAGVFMEQDLQKGQTFNNAYEETKYLAEMAVQEHMASGLPATIYRPAIVVGDSATGATQKYDGLYYILGWLLRQPPVAVLPVIGDPTRYRANFVPRDFVVDALLYLSGLDESEGKVYQLCDPEPLRVEDIIDLAAETTGRSILRLPVPGKVAKGAMRYVPGLKSLMRIEPEAMAYFTQPTHYTCDAALDDLDGSGIACPPLRDYIDILVDYMRNNPDISSRAMA
jgi:nucleoside-diphosphate-sugar epimerase